MNRPPILRWTHKDKSVVRVTDDIYQYLLEAGIVSEINKLKKMLKNNS